MSLCWDWEAVSPQLYLQGLEVKAQRGGESSLLTAGMLTEGCCQ